tara:strand:+ start:456 stop:1847 length:1392 start_codon:yes stop_codon:yes gene_type:complete
MAKVIYDGNLIAPSSFIAVNKTYNNQGGRVVGSKYSITLTCRVFAGQGSPLTTGWWTAGGTPTTETNADDDAKFKSICKKLEIINELFKVGNEGKVLEWQDGTTGVPTKCNPRIVSVDIPDSSSFHRWVEVADYTITFEADDLIRSGAGEDFEVDGDTMAYIESLSESFSLEEQKEGDVTSYVLTRSVQGTGRRHYISDGSVPKEAWERAKDACLLRLANISRHSDFDVIDLTSLTGYDDTRSETIDEANGSYSVTQVRVFASQDFVQTIEVSTNNGAGSMSVTVSGSIRGLGDTAAARLAAAEAGYSESGMYAIANTYSGETGLHPDPLTSTVGKSIYGGTLTFSLQFDDRATYYITGALSENITIDQVSLGTKIASIFVLGRAAGPVLQDLGTREQTVRNLNIEATMPRVDNLLVSNAPNVSAIISAAAPTGGTFYQQQENFSWSPSTGAFTFTTSWIIDP